MAGSYGQNLDQRRERKDQPQSRFVQLWGVGGAHLPVQVDAFLRQLSPAVLGVIVRLVLHHLHPVPSIALLTAVLADHVELADPVLGAQRCW